MEDVSGKPYHYKLTAQRDRVSSESIHPEAVELELLVDGTYKLLMTEAARNCIRDYVHKKKSSK